MIPVLNGCNDYSSTTWSDGIAYQPLAAVPSGAGTMSPTVHKKTYDQGILYQRTACAWKILKIITLDFKTFDQMRVLENMLILICNLVVLIYSLGLITCVLTQFL